MRSKPRSLRALAVLLALFVLSLTAIQQAFAYGPPPSPAAEYGKHFDALSKLSIDVASAMPADQYSFHPHPDSMTFGQLMLHIANTNYAFCAGLKDTDSPYKAPASENDKDAVIKALSGSFDYCATVIPSLTDAQLAQRHNSPDGNLPGREILLAMYIHVAHHRGQAEIYLRDKGIAPPGYRI